MTHTLMPPAKPAPLTRSATSWAVFDAGRHCYSMLIVAAVFTPYVATVLAPNPVAGQEMVATIGLWSGIAGALLATIMGGSIDRMGVRKPALAALVVLLSIVATSFWWASPTGPLNLQAVVPLLMVATVLYWLVEVVHNAMLLGAAAPDELGRASGLGATLGFFVASAALLGFLWAFVLPAEIRATWLPAKPVFGLDPAAHEPQRASGPVVGACLLLALLPLLVFSHDIPRTGVRARDAVVQSIWQVGDLLRDFLARRDVRTFLIARMLFSSGHMGNVMFMAVYAAGAFRWGTAQLMIEALISSIGAVFGGVLSSWLDARVGTKRALLICLLANGLAFAGMIGASHDHIFFFLSYDPAVNGRPWDGPLYSTWPEWAFAICDIINSLFLVACLALSRTLMAKLSPPEQASSLFGLYSLSAAGTAWVAPVLVGAATAVFASQQFGLLPLLALIVAGCVTLMFVRVPPRRQDAP